MTPISTADTKYSSSWPALIATWCIEERRHLYAFVRRNCSCGYDAEDIVQDAVVKALASEHLFDGRSSLKTWIFKIAINVSVDFHRRESRQYQLCTAYANEFEEYASESDCDRHLNREQQEIFNNALKKLASDEYDVYSYVYRYEYSHQDAATALQLPIGRARNLLKKAIKKIERDAMQYSRSRASALI